MNLPGSCLCISHNQARANCNVGSFRNLLSPYVGSQHANVWGGSEVGVLIPVCMQAVVDSGGVWGLGLLNSTHRYAGLRHGDAVRVDGGLHALAEGGGEAVRLVGALAPAPLGTAAAWRCREKQDP